jgi:hypothetical protein
MKQLADTDPMPWGKFSKTKPPTLMQDVPADYLHWLWANGKSGDMNCQVADYIRRNIDSLQIEYPDGIW